MKLLSIIIVAVVVINANAKAQVGQKLTLANYEQRSQMETDSMHVKLNLTAIQKDSVGNINRDYFGALTLLQGQNITVEQRTQQYVAAEQIWKARLASNLTAAQFNQHFAMIEHMKAKWQQKIDSLKAARNQ